MVSFGNMNSDWYTANGIHLHLRIENLTRRCHITCFEAVLQIVAFFISTLILILKEDCKYLIFFNNKYFLPIVTYRKLIFSRLISWMVRCISPYINCRLSSSLSLFQLFYSISVIDRSNTTSFICFCIWKKSSFYFTCRNGEIFILLFLGRISRSGI